MLWSDLVSRVGASRRDNLTAPFPLGHNYPRKVAILLLYYTPVNFENDPQTDKIIRLIGEACNELTSAAIKAQLRSVDAELVNFLKFTLNAVGVQPLK